MGSKEERVKRQILKRLNQKAKGNRVYLSDQPLDYYDPHKDVAFFRGLEKRFLRKYLAIFR